MLWLTHNLISIISLFIAFSSFLFTFWMNHISLSVQSFWIKSVNDSSQKLIITVTNLSPRTTTLTNLLLKKHGKIIYDNGYNFQKVDDGLKTKLHDHMVETHKQNIDKIESETPTFGQSEFSRQSMLEKERHRYLHENMKNFPVLNIPKEPINPEPAKLESVNFTRPQVIFGNHSVEYSYWISSDEIPDKICLTFSRLVLPLHKTKSFKIPAVNDQPNQSTKVQ